MPGSSSRDTWPAGVSKHGASEHVQSGGASDLLQAIAFANIGLSRAAFRGRLWVNVHRPNILRQLKELLSYEGVIGICLGDSAFLNHDFFRIHGANQNKKQQGAAFGGAPSGAATPRGSVGLFHCHTIPNHHIVIQLLRLNYPKIGFKFYMNRDQLGSKSVPN